MFENEQRMVEVNIELETQEHVLASDVIMQELQLANWQSNFLYKMVVKESLKLDVIITSIFLSLWVCRESETTALSKEASVTLAKCKPFSKLVFDV